jgi:hypothetical protein
MLLLALLPVAGPAGAQDFVYVEPGLRACPPAPARAHEPPIGPVRLQPGVPRSGRIQVGCGFDKGSYTLTLHSTDPGARFAPASFIVNFGRLAGSDTYAVRFASPGRQQVSVVISPNMGSPPVAGRFASDDAEVEVVAP